MQFLKKIFTSIVFLTSILTFSQSKVDTLLVDIYKKSVDNRIVIRPSESRLLVSYKFCEDWKMQIDYLKINLNEEQNEELINDQNGTFNLIGLLSNLTKHNSKKYAEFQFENLIKTETKMISLGCGDAFTSLTLQEYYLKLLTEPNKFIEHNFSFKKDEIEILKTKLE